MITFELDQKHCVLHVRPSGPLAKEDFEELTKAVDPFIEEKGRLLGLVIETESFPGWESLGALIRHFKFVKNHHSKIEKVALVTNSKLADIAEKIGKHFVVAEIKHFPAGQLEAAMAWIADEQ